MQFSKISSNVYNGDRDTLFNWYGTNFQAEDGTQLDRDLGDGEKNAGFVDWDGRWTKDKFSFFSFFINFYEKTYYENLIRMAKGQHIFYPGRQPQSIPIVMTKRTLPE